MFSIFLGSASSIKSFSTLYDCIFCFHSYHVGSKSFGNFPNNSKLLILSFRFQTSAESAVSCAYLKDFFLQRPYSWKTFCGLPISFWNGLLFRDTVVEHNFFLCQDCFFINDTWSQTFVTQRAKLEFPAMTCRFLCILTWAYNIYIYKYQTLRGDARPFGSQVIPVGFLLGLRTSLQGSARPCRITCFLWTETYFLALFKYHS